MTTTTIYKEEESFNVYWQIKNFSFFCEEMSSPVFSISGTRYFLHLQRRSLDIECKLYLLLNSEETGLSGEISFLSSDGSQEESISNGPLRVPKDAIFGNRGRPFLTKDTLTVRLRYPTDSERGTFFIRSEIAVKRAYFLWTIRNFSTYRGNTRKFVEKSELYGDIQLNFKPMEGFNTTEQFYIEISQTGGEKCYCTLRMSVLDVDGNALNEASGGFVFEKTDGLQIRVFPAFFKKSKLLACKNLLLPEDTLSLKCNFAISLGTVTDQATDIRYCENAIHLLKESDALQTILKEVKVSGSIFEFSANLLSVLQDSTLFDASLQIGSKVINVHKIILSARSPVFKEMFTKNMKKTVNNIFVVEDLDVETLGRLVVYMYTDTILDSQWEDIKKLYSAADKYEVLSLKKKCVHFLETNLSISSACEALVLANLHQDGDLKTVVLDFISENDSVVFTSEVWKELEKNNSSLALQVMREIYISKDIRIN